MVAMGRALMSRPRLLLMDEPSMGLSPALVQQNFRIIKEVHESGVAVLMVEQNATMALSIADRGYVLATGAIVLAGPAAELLEARTSSGRTWAGEEAAMTAGAGATVRTVLDTGGGLVRRQVEVPAGAHHAGSAGPGGELCFVIEGAGQLGSAAAPGRPVRPGTGVWLPPGTSYSLAAAGPGPLRLDSVLLPAPRPARSRTARSRTARGRTARALTARRAAAGGPGRAAGGDHR